MGRACIFTGDGGSGEIRGFKVMEVKVSASARVIGAPIETGQVIFDNKVINPTRVMVMGVVDTTSDDAQEAASAIVQLMSSTDDQFASVSDGIQVYGNLILESYSSSRNVDRPDLMVYNLQYVEALVSDTLASNSTSQYSNTVNSGTTQGT